MTAIADFITGLPKAELHLHIEGSLDPELAFDMAWRNGVQLGHPSIEALRAAYAFRNLQEFLDLYYQCMKVLRREQDFFDLTWAYLSKARDQGVRHAEIFFDPQAHTARGVTFDAVIEGIWAALRQAEAEWGLSSRLILCFLRHLDEASAFATLEESRPWRHCIAAVGLDSSEVGHPPSKFTRVFAKARAEGLPAVAHAGEEGPPAYVREALDLLQAVRIDHGNRALEDDDLVRRLVAAKIPLTVCPLSNLRLCVVDDLIHHPLKRMLDLGLMATVNSDDPAYFGGYVADNYLAVHKALGLGRGDLIRLARNSFEASFLDPAAKGRLMAEVDAYAAAWPVISPSGS